MSKVASMKCPICKTKDRDNLLIDENRPNKNDYVYFYCLFGCDSFTMERNAFEKMTNKEFSEEDQKKLIEISLTKVICESDV